MATAIWIGGATTRAQVETVTVSGTVNGTTFTLQMNSVTVATFLGTASDNIDTVAAALVADWLDDLGAGQDITPANTTATTSGTFTLTAKIAGKPFTAPSRSSGGLVVANTNPSSGSNDWNVGSNWASHAVPSVNDHIQVTGSSSILYTLGQSGTTYNSFKQLAGSTAGLGLPETNLDLTILNLGAVELAGTGQAYLNITSTGTLAPIIYNTLSASTGQYGLILTGPDFSTIRFMKGSMKFLGTAVTVEQEYRTSKLADTRLWLHPDAAVTNLKKTGGDCLSEENTVITNQDAGTLRIAGSATVTTLTCGGGTITYDSSGTVTTLNANGGTVDFTSSQTGQTVTTTNLGGGKLKVGENTTLGTTNYLRRYELAPLT
jgi:hypothetical protein